MMNYKIFGTQVALAQFGVLCLEQLNKTIKKCQDSLRPCRESSLRSPEKKNKTHP
jgi:hypothetical protein